VDDLADVDDIGQDAFSELLLAYRLMQPVEHVAAWLLRVARNRIIDRYRARVRPPSSIGTRARRAMWQGSLREWSLARPGHTSPRSANEMVSPSPTMMWSSKRMSTSASASLTRWVISSSARLGSAIPDG
jgi:DNA-directed RNA polymerase specialized sigma24 family protein